MFVPADPGPGASREAFEDSLNKQALYLLILFLARFALNYINKV